MGFGKEGVTPKQDGAIIIAPPQSALPKGPKLLGGVDAAGAAAPVGPSDAFDGMTPMRNVGYRVRAPEPGPIVPGPIPEADIPVPVGMTLLRVGGDVLGVGAIAGGIAIAIELAAVLGPAGALILGFLLAIAGLILLGLCLRGEVAAQDKFAKTGPNTKTFHDFSGEVSFTPEFYDRPNNEAELADEMKQAWDTDKTFKVIGSGHSFVDTFATEGHLVSLERMNWMQVVDKEKGPRHSWWRRQAERHQRVPGDAGAALREPRRYHRTKHRWCVEHGHSRLGRKLRHHCHASAAHEDHAAAS